MRRSKTRMHSLSSHFLPTIKRPTSIVACMQKPGIAGLFLCINHCEFKRVSIALV